MTTPTLQDCAHQGEGWCLTCVGELAAENERLRAEREWCKGWAKELVRLFPLGLAEVPVRRLEKRLLGEP